MKTITTVQSGDPRTVTPHEGLRFGHIRDISKALSELSISYREGTSPTAINSQQQRELVLNDIQARDQFGRQFIDAYLAGDDKRYAETLMAAEEIFEEAAKAAWTLRHANEGGIIEPFSNYCGLAMTLSQAPSFQLMYLSLEVYEMLAVKLAVYAEEQDKQEFENLVGSANENAYSKFPSERVIAGNHIRKVIGLSGEDFHKLNLPSNVSVVFLNRAEEFFSRSDKKDLYINLDVHHLIDAEIAKKLLDVSVGIGLKQVYYTAAEYKRKGQDRYETVDDLLKQNFFLGNHLSQRRSTTYLGDGIFTIQSDPNGEVYGEQAGSGVEGMSPDAHLLNFFASQIAETFNLEDFADEQKKHAFISTVHTRLYCQYVPSSNLLSHFPYLVIQQVALAALANILDIESSDICVARRDGGKLHEKVYPFDRDTVIQEQQAFIEIDPGSASSYQDDPRLKERITLEEFYRELPPIIESKSILEATEHLFALSSEILKRSSVAQFSGWKELLDLKVKDLRKHTEQLDEFMKHLHPDQVQEVVCNSLLYSPNRLLKMLRKMDQTHPESE